MAALRDSEQGMLQRGLDRGLEYQPLQDYSAFVGDPLGYKVECQSHLRCPLQGCLCEDALGHLTAWGKKGLPDPGLNLAPKSVPYILGSSIIHLHCFLSPLILTGSSACAQPTWPPAQQGLPTAPQAATESYRELLAGEGDKSLANHVSLIHLSCFQLSASPYLPQVKDLLSLEFLRINFCSD